MHKQTALHPEWRSRLEPTKFPFADEATLRNDAGTFIPPSGFLDAILYPVGGTHGLYLSSAIVTAEKVTFWIGDAATDKLAYAVFAQGEAPNLLPLVDSYGRPAGLLVSEASRLEAFQAWGLGTHTFTEAQARFATVCCIPTPEVTLRGFLLDDGSVVTGDIWLLGDDGVILSLETQQPLDSGCLTPSEASAETQQVVRVDVVGDPLFRRRLCEGVFSTPKFIKTLTCMQGDYTFTCEPDEQGDIKLTVGHSLADDTILRVRTTAEGLVIEAVGEALEGVR